MTLIATAPRARCAQGTSVVLLTMSLGVLIAQIDTSVVNLAVKPIGANLGVGVTTLHWVVDAYNLVYASLLLTAGTLADIYGRRRIFVLGIALFAIGSLICGLAPNAATLIAGRGIAGLGAALEVPTSLAILTVAFPDTAKRTRALGLWASCYGLAMVIGPIAGGVLVDAVGWRSIFLLITPLCVLALVLTWTAVPESKDPKGRKLDPGSQTLAVIALGSLSLAAIEGPGRGFTSPAIVTAFAIAATASAWFLRRQTGTGGALVPLSLFRNRVFSAALGVAASMTFGMYAMLFLVPLYLQAARGATALLAGVVLLPMSLSFVVVSQYSGRIANAFGPRLPMTAGMALMGSGLFMLALPGVADSLSLIEPAMLLLGCGRRIWRRSRRELPRRALLQPCAPC